MTLVVLCLPGESQKIVEFKGWRDPTFIALYLCTSFMGKSAHERLDDTIPRAVLTLYMYGIVSGSFCPCVMLIVAAVQRAIPHIFAFRVPTLCVMLSYDTTHS